MNSRKRVYGFRQRVLNGADCRAMILDMVDRQVDQHINLSQQRLRRILCHVGRFPIGV